MPLPFDARMLDAGDGHWIYVEEVGHKGGRPCLFLHGGPGSGAQPLHRTLFDLKRDHVFLFDQRGAGRSHPHLSLMANTTAHQIADIEAIRTHFGIEKWLVTGGSWGSTLALAYAETHPDRVTALVLRAIFLGTDEEVRWAFIDGPRTFRPELHAEFVRALPEEEQHDPLSAYVARLLNSDPAIHRPAAMRWNAYERILSERKPASCTLPVTLPPEARTPPTPVMEAHYIRNRFFLRPNQLLGEAGRLSRMPGVIVQGRYDLICPPQAAYRLARAWSAAELKILDDAGHAMTEPGVMEALSSAIARMP